MFIAWILTFLDRGIQHIIKRKYVALTLLLEIIRLKMLDFGAEGNLSVTILR